MQSKEQQSQKTQQIEELINHDCSNGRDIQKKVKAKLMKMGQCSESLVKDLQAIKLGR